MRGVFHLTSEAGVPLQCLSGVTVVAQAGTSQVCGSLGM